QPGMQADVDKLVSAARFETLWPWHGPIPEVQRVVRHGKAVAPLLLELLGDDPDDVNTPQWDTSVQQQAALALCRLYRVRAECGRVYCNRVSRERNKDVQRFWQAKIAKR